jgi:hypothetical protein
LLTSIAQLTYIHEYKFFAPHSLQPSQTPLHATMSKYDEDEIQWSDDEKLFDSPIAQKSGASSSKANGKAAGSSQPEPKPRQAALSQEDAAEAREAALQQELENVRKINTVIEGVVESLEKAKGNMEVRILYSSHVPIKESKV